VCDNHEDAIEGYGSCFAMAKEIQCSREVEEETGRSWDEKNENRKGFEKLRPGVQGCSNTRT
jgi:hypothetical protein